MNTGEKLKEIIMEKAGALPCVLCREGQFPPKGADSLQVTEILMEAEYVFGVEIPQRDLKEISTLGELEDYIEDKMF